MMSHHGCVNQSELTIRLMKNFENRPWRELSISFSVWSSAWSILFSTAWKVASTSLKATSVLFIKLESDDAGLSLRWCSIFNSHALRKSFTEKFSSTILGDMTLVVWESCATAKLTTWTSSCVGWGWLKAGGASSSSSELNLQSPVSIEAIRFFIDCRFLRESF